MPVLADEPVDVAGLRERDGVPDPGGLEEVGARFRRALAVRGAGPGVAGRVERAALVGPELLVELLAGDVRREVGDGFGVAATGPQEVLDLAGLERVACGVAEPVRVAGDEVGAGLPERLDLRLDRLAALGATGRGFKLGRQLVGQFSAIPDRSGRDVMRRDDRALRTLGVAAKSAHHLRIDLVDVAPVDQEVGWLRRQVDALRGVRQPARLGVLGDASAQPLLANNVRSHGRGVEQRRRPRDVPEVQAGLQRALSLPGRVRLRRQPSVPAMLRAHVLRRRHHQPSAPRLLHAALEQPGLGGLRVVRDERAAVPDRPPPRSGRPAPSPSGWRAPSPRSRVSASGPPRPRPRGCRSTGSPCPDLRVVRGEVRAEPLGVRGQVGAHVLRGRDRALRDHRDGVAGGAALHAPDVPVVRLHVAAFALRRVRAGRGHVGALVVQVPLLADLRVPDAADDRVARLEHRDALAALLHRDHVAVRVPQRLELRVGAALELAADQVLRPAPLVDPGGEVLPERERRPDRAGPLDPPGPGERARGPADPRRGAGHVEAEQDRVLPEVLRGVRRVLHDALTDRLRVLARHAAPPRPGAR
jgi:hypothetical protein